MLFLLFLQGGRPLQVHPCVGALALWRARRELLAGTWVHPVGHRHGSVARIVGRARGWESGGRSHGGREISPRQRRDIRADERIMGGERFIIIIIIYLFFIYFYLRNCSFAEIFNQAIINNFFSTLARWTRFILRRMIFHDWESYVKSWISNEIFLSMEKKKVVGRKI